MQYTKENARTLAGLKIAAFKKTLDLAPAVIDALRKFDGKSITGNKKRITDAIKAIDPALYVDIDWDQWLKTKLNIKYWESNRSVKIDESWEYIDGSFDLLSYFYAKDNILNFADAEKAILAECERIRAYIEKAQYTADNIETIRATQQRLCQELNDLVRGCDHEIAERFDVTMTYYK